MKLPEDVSAAIAELPEALRAIVEAELVAGNEVAEVFHGHPVAPAGVGIRLVRPPTHLPVDIDGRGVQPCRFPAWDGSSGYADEPRHSFVLGPPEAPSEASDPDETRDAVDSTGQQNATVMLDRFERSLRIDREKWREGVGYDLDAIRDASHGERVSIETMLLRRGVRDWRDVEALAILDSPRARDAMRSAATSDNHEVALAVVRHAPALLDEEARVSLIVRGLEVATFYGGLTQALSQAEECHPAPVIEALLQGAVGRDGGVAVHFAALLMSLHGQAETAFDWEQRPFFLTFKTQDPTARAAAFRELCRKIDVDAEKYLEPE